MGVGVAIGAEAGAVWQAVRIIDSVIKGSNMVRFIILSLQGFAG
jgi:hypothetical protein